MRDPSRENVLVVFAQRTDARIDIDAWNSHATRFFATRIGLGAERRYADGKTASASDTVSFVVAPDGEPPGVRTVTARPCEHRDYALAEAIEAKRGHTGLSLLARRCAMAWLIIRDGSADKIALRLAAVLASVLLGPILDESAGELFGVKTARNKLESL